ncbi:MazG nucleotide pyrophosphohydrolase domain-containing protein [Streptomyces sp. NBC_00439]|uniref:MazG nucleotide pyrophosphohydrolase domain-containing protein n=1 Tax=unclassified Streptomyces TaxID=2593676 RepID=UPI00224D9DAE|nr:MazG nucleotide pyrophosphohydrolase domain-containing protein [Streptomyces sp. NBC_00439]MCX5103675.1 nucleotide pyrophosphohydrolase [Streptomyces sp. NBC_00439]WSX06181.1 nucleotide pyrophosphohydrolase [Streptomyces sp. NBC_00987]
MVQEVGQMEFFTKRAMQIHALYDEFNLSARGRTWSREDFMLGFVGDVGDLAKIVMAREGARSHPAPSLDAALAHELADCLWSVLVLARLYGIDLGQAFTQTMSELETSIGADLQRAQTEVHG